LSTTICRDHAPGEAALWAYIDVRDVALACRLAIESPRVGCDTAYIAAPDSLMQEPTRDLVAKYYPGFELYAPGFGGRMSSIDVRHAADALGFKAQHLWEDEVKLEDVA
jgi:hypothetical protein